MRFHSQALNKRCRSRLVASATKYAPRTHTTERGCTERELRGGRHAHRSHRRSKSVGRAVNNEAGRPGATRASPPGRRPRSAGCRSRPSDACPLARPKRRNSHLITRQTTGSGSGRLARAADTPRTGRGGGTKMCCTSPVLLHSRYEFHWSILRPSGRRSRLMATLT
ncbi:hypothetical protein MTO96_009850 [Rhipicephalus appendiculatus]